MTLLGTTLFSFTPDWRAGADATTLLERLAGAGCGPAVEVIGHQAWRHFPQIGADDERAFRDAVDRLGLVPVALGVYTDLYRRPGRVMTDAEAFADIAPQLAVASRLGFQTVRATLGMAPGLLRRVLDEAERLGVVLTFEVQGANAPESAPVVELLALQEATGSACLGLTLDFSLTTPALPDAFGAALQRYGLADDAVEDIYRAWADESPIGARIGAALDVVRGHRDEGPLNVLVAGVLGRCGRALPADWAHALPAVRHAHAKFWDPDVESVRAPHAAWLRALGDAEYAGAVLSEWGGHELLDSTEADALEVTRDHIRLLEELVGQRAEATR